MAKHRYKSANVLRIQAAYEAAGFKLWTLGDLHALCFYMNVTQDEMCALLQIKTSALSHWKKDGIPGSVSLLLEQLKRFYTECFTGVPQLPVIPLGILGRKTAIEKKIKPPKT